MSNIYIVAGQSNANNAFEAIRAGLLAQDPTCTVIEIADAGAPLTWQRGEDSDWYNPTELQTDVTDAVIAAMRSDPEAQLSGIVWIQGEGDTLDCARPENYSEELTELFNAILADLSEELPGPAIDPADVPLLIVGLSSFAPASADRGHWSIVQQAQLQFGAGWDGAAIVNMDMLAALAGIPPEDMFKDDLHYSEELTDALGSAVADWLFGETGGSGAAIDPVMVLGSDKADDIGFGPTAAGQHQGDVQDATVMVGYGGNDRYRIMASDTLVVELAGEGRDKVVVFCDYDMGQMAQGVEELVVAGTGGRVVTGNALANKMTGGTDGDQLCGEDGSDTLRGGEGNDRLDGGNGIDELDGGAGSDRFVFARVTDSGRTDSMADVITDLVRGQDRIDLKAIDAFAETGANDAFVWKGTAAFSSTTKGEVSYEKFNNAGMSNDYTMVYVDNDGDKGVEMAIRLTGLHNLQASDFIL
jgi:hypothetical protein